ncbi:MAG: redoxin domain-containing protein [Pirellulaceae bacterium]
MPRAALIATTLVTLLSLGVMSARAKEAADVKQKSFIGRKVAPFSLGDFRGKTWTLAEFSENKVVVIAFMGTECPLVTHYGPRLAELAAKYEQQGVAFLGINANQQDSLAEIAHFAKKSKIEFPLLRDAGNKVADALQAERTPEVFVLDAERVIRYHGRIDDQFTYGKGRDKPEQTWLATAIDELLSGKEVTTKEVASIGCHIGRLLTPKVDSDVTYSKQISRIFQDNCVHCHRPGEIGPFALTNYDESVGWAEMIAEVVSEQRMPPWHADPKHGKFANDARLSDEEKSLIHRWVAAGAPEGDKTDLPPAKQFADGWQIGQPDQIVFMSEKPYNVPAKGEVRYQHFVVDPGFKEDKWIKAAECRPGNRAVVHHIIVGLADNFRQRKETAGVHSEFLTATAPGARPLFLTDGRAKLIPAGSKLVFQIHYTPNGTATTDRSSVGFVFADPAEVKHQVGTDKAANQGFRIPAGASNHKVEAYHSFSKDMVLLSLFPHMHLRGKAFRYTAIYPDKTQEILLNVPHYDFNWQNGYELAEPKQMPAGTRIFCEAWFDNSEGNIANPDPTSTVTWGDQTWEEMMIGYFDATPAVAAAGKISGSRTAEFLKKLKDGSSTPDENLSELAKTAFKSDKDLAEFSEALQAFAPQLDRLCWTTVEGSDLIVKKCVQDSALEKEVGGAGKKVPAKWMKLSTYATAKEPILHQRLEGASGIDLQYMAKAYQSSYHLPIKKDGLSGSINFWSAEKDAFPPELTKALGELVKGME